MCEYCNGAGCNMSVNRGYISIIEDGASPSGYSLVADNSYGEYENASTPAWYCLICGRRLVDEVENVRILQEYKRN